MNDLRKAFEKYIGIREQKEMPYVSDEFILWLMDNVNINLLSPDDYQDEKDTLIKIGRKDVITFIVQKKMEKSSDDGYQLSSREEEIKKAFGKLGD